MNRNYWIVVGGLVGGLALLLLGGWRFAVHPLTAECADEVAQKQALQQKLQTARDTAAQFTKFKAQAENMRRDLDFYRSRTDGPLDDVEVSRMVSALGNQLGLSQLAVTVKDLPGSGATADLGLYDVDVKFEADFDQLGRFLNACVSQRRIVVPDSVSLKNIEDPNGQYFNTVSVDLSLLIYGGHRAKPVGRF